MMQALRVILIGTLCLGLTGPALAGEKGNKKAGGAKNLNAMSQEEPKRACSKPQSKMR